LPLSLPWYRGARRLAWDGATSAKGTPVPEFRRARSVALGCGIGMLKAASGTR